MTTDRLAHPIGSGTLGLPCGVLGIKFVLNGDVEVTRVLLVGLAGERAVDLLTLLHGKNVLEIQDGLLPVGVLGVRSGGETDGLVTGGELDVEPGHQGMDEVVSPSSKLELGAESKIGGCALVKIKRKDEGGIRHNSLHLDNVDKGLRQGRLLEWGVVEAIDIIPD
jgi:hypothetical protein